MKYKIVEDPKNLCVKCPKSLKEKVFIPKTSNCQYSFTIGKLGESLWSKTLAQMKIQDFIFFDPNNRESPCEYNSFFDPHLKNHFKRKSVLKHLRKNHLITDRNEIISSVVEYNDFRKSIHRLKSEGNCHNKKHGNYQDVLKQQIKNYQANLKRLEDKEKKFRERYLGSEQNPLNFEHVTRSLKRKRMKMEEERMSKFIEQVNAYKERVKRIEQLKLLKNSQIKERGIYRNLELVKKQIYVLENRKARRAQIKKKLFEKDEALKRKFHPYEGEEPINYIIRCPLEI